MRYPMLAAVIIAASWLQSASVPADEGYRVLYIGDSHTVGSFGTQLDTWIRGQLTPGSTLASFGSCGSRISSWYNGFVSPACYIARPSTYRIGIDPPIEAMRGRGGRRRRLPRTPSIRLLLNTQRPNLTVVALGSNQMGYPERYHRRTIRQIRADLEAAGSQCVWIGPPNGPNKPAAELELFYRSLNDEVGNYCTIVDSRKATHTVEACGPRHNQPCANPHFDQLTGRYAEEAGERVIADWLELSQDVIGPLLN